MAMILPAQLMPLLAQLPGGQGHCMEARGCCPAWGSQGLQGKSEQGAVALHVASGGCCRAFSFKKVLPWIHQHRAARSCCPAGLAYFSISKPAQRADLLPRGRISCPEGGWADLQHETTNQAF